jgi:hypothetical protein
MVLVGKWDAGKNILKALYMFPLKWKKIMQRRGIAQSLRTKSDEDLFKVIMRQPPVFFYWNRFWHYLRTGQHG